MFGAETRLLPGAAELARLHAAELPQKDELCGAFNTLLALRLAGITTADGQQLDQDEVGVAAGSALGPAGYDEELPPHEKGRKDYRLEHPRVAAEVAGTNAGGLVRAVDELSRGSRVAIPTSGPWTAASVLVLLEMVRGRARRGARAERRHPLPVGLAAPGGGARHAYLETGDDGVGPAPDWAVGHFVGCLGTLRGARGTLAIITDTYEMLGLHGVHLQPVERLAAALQRKGMSPGGALVIVPAERRPPVSQALVAEGLELGIWDNGSVDVRQDAAAPR